MSDTPGQQHKHGLVRSTIDWFVQEVAKFGVVGLINFVVQIAFFNLLLATLLKHHTVSSNIASNVIATVSAYFMNKHWAFKHRERIHPRHEATLFFLINVVAIGLGAAIVAFPHYALHLHASLEDNFFNLVGVAAGTLLRFWAYRKWVWPDAGIGEALAVTTGSD